MKDKATKGKRRDKLKGLEKLTLEEIKEKYTENVSRKIKRDKEQL